MRVSDGGPVSSILEKSDNQFFFSGAALQHDMLETFSPYRKQQRDTKINYTHININLTIVIVLVFAPVIHIYYLTLFSVFRYDSRK